MAFGYRESPLLWPLFAGRAAVILFFVLSGFVLSLPFWTKGRNDNYGRYLIRRCFRIYIPYVAAVAVAVGGALLFPHSALPLSEWFHHTWQTNVTPGLIGRHLLMAGGDELNAAFWSLRYEVEMSIIFPLLLLALRVVPPGWALGLSAVLFVGASTRGDESALYLTLKYGALFAIGGVLGRSISGTRQRWQGISPLSRVALLLAALFLYFGYGDWAMAKLHMSLPDDVLVALGACGMLVCAMHLSPLRRLLHSTVPEYLGRISYSMYLIHGTVLFAVLNLLYGKVPNSLLIAVYLVATLVLSHLFCILVEEPSLRAGKTIAGRWTGSRQLMVT